jgi:hypothetical protein
MRPLTILLLVTAITACFVAALVKDGPVALLARLVYGLAFVGSVIAFVRGLPRAPDETSSATAPGVRGVDATSMSAHG